MLERLRTRKNLILQGPPGTGKTWLAKRLAFALIGERYDTPFFVRPRQSRRALWFLHLSRHPARSDGCCAGKGWTGST